MNVPRWELCSDAGLCEAAPCSRHSVGQQEVHEHEAFGGSHGRRLHCRLTSFSRSLQTILLIILDSTRLPTQASLWVNRHTMFHLRSLCEKAQKARPFQYFLSLNVFSPIITGSINVVADDSDSRNIIDVSHCRPNGNREPFFLSLAVILSSDLMRISIWWMGVSRIKHLELIVQNLKLE